MDKAISALDQVGHIWWMISIVCCVLWLIWATINVQYDRPGKTSPVSYTCRLSGGQILTRDESLSGARWYGTSPDDSKLQYHFAESRLIVQDIGNGRVLNERAFSKDQIPD